MIQSVSFLILFLSIIVPVLSQEDGGYFHRLESFPHTLKKPFLDKYFSSRFYDYGGDTLIKSDSYIRLTGDRQGESGWVFSKLPAIPESFQIEFDFKIHGESTSLYGDGLAMWIVTHKGESGPVFGSSDFFQGLGIFFDTYKNNRPGKTFPYVMAMMGDGKTPYDSANDGLKNELGGCSARGLHNPRDISHARLTYVKDRFLSLDLDYKTYDKDERKWSNCFVLSAQEATLPSSSLFLGFSARTGQLSENHDIHRVQMFSLRNPPNSYEQLIDIDAGKTITGGSSSSSSYNGKTSTSAKSKSGGSWLWFFFKIFGVLVTLVVLALAYGLYLTKVKDRQRSKDDFFASY